jgi:hypothetical protein
VREIGGFSVLGALIGVRHRCAPLFSGKLWPVTPNRNAKPDVVPPLRDAPHEPSGQWQTGSPAANIVREVGGPAGPEPTRYGDWELRGRCVDF